MKVDIICIDKSHVIDKAHPKSALTIGKIYQTYNYDYVDNFIWLIDDDGKKTFYRKSNFILLSDIQGLRKYKLKKLNEV